jgi:hypothetical protein
MLPPMAETIRPLLRSSPAANALASTLRPQITSIISSEMDSDVRTIVRVNIAIGSYGLDTHLDANIHSKESEEIPDVIVWFLSDPTNIDSKQITFVNKALPPQAINKIFKVLYKVPLETNTN